MNWKNWFSSSSDNTIYNPLSKDILKAYNKNRPLGPQKIVCYAPFRSIYFGHHGLANACCYNRTHVLGQYPKQSIKEIWFGQQADRLRNYLKHDDFSLGCGSCKQQLVAGNFDAVKAKQYDESRKNKNHFPSVIEFELSNTCNLECEMCSGDFSSLIRTKREGKEPLKSPYDDNFVKQLEEFIPYLEEVKFYGGEPFLIEIYYQIWELIMQINPSVRISVQTNCTTLNNRVKRILERTNFHINVSVDSLQKERYEWIRKNAVFERTMENLKWFRQYCKERGTFFGISMCAMRNNWRELPDFINFCNDLDVPVYFHTVFNPPHLAIHNLDSSALAEIIDYLSPFTFPSDTPVQKKNKRHYENTIAQYRSWYEREICRDELRVSRFHDFEEFESMLIDHIRKDKSLSSQWREKRMINIQQKLTIIRSKLPEELIDKLISEVNYDDPYFFENTIDTVERHEISELIELAKQSAKFT